MSGPMMTHTYGFVGLGLMGQPMCLNLAQKMGPSHRIKVFDVAEIAMDQLVEKFPDQIIRCSSTAEVANDADVIFTMLPEGRNVREAYMGGPDSFCSVDLNNKMLVDCSTIDPATSMAIKHHVEEQFEMAAFYDASVSGGVIGAAKGSLSFFVGCRENDTNIQRIKPVLLHMGKCIIPCGGPSLGLAAKLCNNYLSGVLTIANSETFNMGMRAGLDPRTLRQVIAAGSSQNTICDKFCPVPHVDPDSPSSHAYQGGFRVTLMRKDFGLALDMAKRVGATTVLSGVACAMYDELSKEETYRDLDVRAVFRYLGGQEDWNPTS